MTTHPVVQMWPAITRGPFKVNVYVDTSSGSARCVGLDIRGFDGEAVLVKPGQKFRPDPRPGQKALGEISTTELRKLSVPRMLAQAVKDIGLMIRTISTEDSDLEPVLKALDEKGRRYHADHFKEVAKVYSDAVPNKPTQAVADHFHISRSAAAKQVARCRELGLLGPARPGRAGGGNQVNQ